MEKRIRLEELDLTREEELDWLYAFIQNHHSTPKQILPTREELRSPTHRYFRAMADAPAETAGKVIGMTSYEIRTPFLAETQKTIVAPELRNQGWGRVLSQAIEDKCKRAGFKKVRTTIYCGNTEMILIKLAQGYKIEGFHPDHEAPGLHEFSLGKRI